MSGISDFHEYQIGGYNDCHVNYASNGFRRISLLDLWFRIYMVDYVFLLLGVISVAMLPYLSAKEKEGVLDIIQCLWFQTHDLHLLETSRNYCISH